MNLKKLLKICMTAGTCAAVLLTASPVSADILDANTDPANTQKSDETITVCLASEPSALFMGGTGKLESEMVIIQDAFTDELVDIDRKTGELKPSLAKEWNWLDDTHCQFVLRDDVVMTDGSLLVADDVVYSINTFMEYSANSDTGRFFVGATADDEHTVTIEFNTVAPDLLNMIAWSNFGIFSEDEINAAGGVENAANNPVFGSGKYRFKEWVKGQYVLLERNEDYWDPDYTGYFKEIKFIFINDPASRAMSVQSGDSQVCIDMPVSMASAYQNDERVKLIVNTMGNTARMFYNMGPNAGATSDIRVRQAIDKALDFDAIAFIGTGGLGTEIHGYFEPDSKYYNETFAREEREVDVEGAKALLAEAGYADGLSLMTITTSDSEALNTVVQENLRNVGIDLQINVYDIPTFVQESNAGNYDLIMIGDSVDVRYPTLMMFFQQQFIDTFCIGGCKWTTPEIEEKIATLIQTKDDEEAKRVAGELENIYKEEMCFSNTYSELRSALTGSDINGYCTIERGYLDATTMYKN